MLFSIKLNLLLALTLLTVSIAPAFADSNESEVNVEAGKTAFFKYGEPETAKGYTLSQFKKNNLILMFWASWCGPCLEKIKVLKTLKPQLEKNGFTLLSINIEDAYRETLPKLIKKMEINYPIYLDQTTNLRTALDMHPNAVNVITPWDKCYNRGPDLGPNFRSIENEEEGAEKELIGVLNHFFNEAKKSGC